MNNQIDKIHKDVYSSIKELMDNANWSVSCLVGRQVSTIKINK